MIITDIMDNRLEVAKSMGADYTYKVITNIITNFISILVPILSKPRGICLFQATRGKTAEEMAADVKELLGGEMPDITIECSGVESSVRWISVNMFQDIKVRTICEGLGSWQPSLEAAWCLWAWANQKS